MPGAHMENRQAAGPRCESWMGCTEQDTDMLRVIVNDGDKIDRALKQFKRKCNNTKLVQELRQRQEFEKPSVTARRKRLKAEYVQRLRNEQD